MPKNFFLVWHTVCCSPPNGGCEGRHDPPRRGATRPPQKGGAHSGIDLVLHSPSNVGYCIFFSVCVVRSLLENRPIATYKIHDSTDTVQAYTLAHVLHKYSTVPMVSN